MRRDQPCIFIPHKLHAARTRSASRGSLAAGNARKPFGPRWGSLQRSPRPHSWCRVGWLPPLQEPHPPLSVLLPFPVPHSPVSKMTYTVSSATLNSTIPYHTPLVHRVHSSHSLISYDAVGFWPCFLCPRPHFVPADDAPV